MNAESDEPELTLDRALSLLEYSEWKKLFQMFEVIDEGLNSQKPIDSHKKLGSRIGMESWEFSRFRRDVMTALSDLLPGTEDLITLRTPTPTETGERVWEWTDWVIRTARSTCFRY